MSAMLQNWDVAERALETAQNSTGSAMRENEAYAESIEGHLTKLANTWQEIWGGVANRDQINFFIDMADAISNVVSEVGLLNTAVGVLGGALSVKSGVGRGKAISLPSLNMPTVCWW